uniref:Uncharacterized protein n=1 Tax=Arundo donax TaxID=35708 RepID=A0A0A9DMU4_ARUDO
MTVSAQSWRPISTMVPSTSARLSSRGILSGRRSSAEYPIVSRTVSVPIRLSSCVTYAAAPKESLALRPLRSTLPERKALAARRPARASRRVDLPEPEGPMSAVSEPGSANPVSSSSTVCVLPGPSATVTVRSFHVSLADTSPMRAAAPAPGSALLSRHSVSLSGLSPTTMAPPAADALACSSTMACPAAADLLVVSLASPGLMAGMQRS